MKDKEEGDPFLMVQIISSAIVNVPPPQALLTVLNQNSTYVTFNGNVEERMYNLFKRSPNGNTVSKVLDDCYYLLTDITETKQETDGYEKLLCRIL